MPTRSILLAFRKARLRVALAFYIAVTILSSASATLAEEPATPSAEQSDFFERKIRPVLVDRCFKCHSSDADKVGGGLLLDSRDAMRSGGESGAAVVPGDTSGSLLLSAIRHDGFEMPPDGKLPDEIIRDFEQWINSGAPDPRDGTEPLREASQIDFETGRQFWSFQPPNKHPLPSITSTDWPRRRIDWFLLAKLEAAGLAPSPVAEQRTLIRRLSFDLTGLPPTPEEVNAYVNDTEPNAYERLVDRLLASPHYGERMARLWLDVARFAEDQAHLVGSDRSLCYPNAYLYRDWVIAAFNQDMPYDEFIRMQLAADLYEPEQKDKHAALGFLGLGPKYYDRKALAVKAEEWEDRVDTVTRGLMGLTVACARCHDHKFDPIEAEDYHALAGVFASTDMYNRPLKPDVEMNDRGQAKKPEEAVHIVRDGEAQDLTLFIRGNVENKGEVVPRRFVRVLGTDEPVHFAQGSGRRELAEVITSDTNPLSARVIVNRVWGLYFGRPLVGTPSNFGETGERPSHPELLDDLAVRFMEAGWSLKWLTREMVLSAAYRQSSFAEPSKQQADPENRLLARMNRRRLSVEAWRDAMLVANGRLERAVGGPSIDPLDPDQSRRTIYSSVSRLELNRLLALFDYPDANLHADRRTATTTPLQKLFVLNSPVVMRQSEALAQKVLEVSSSGDVCGQGPMAVSACRIQTAYQRLFAREPSSRETEIGQQYLDACSSSGASEEQAWQRYAQALMASNEFMYVD